METYKKRIIFLTFQSIGCTHDIYGMAHLSGSMLQASSLLDIEKLNLMSITTFNILITSNRSFSTLFNVLPEFSQYLQQPPVSKMGKWRFREVAY